MTCRCRSGECDPECDGPKLRAEIERLEKREVDAWTERDAYLEQNVKLKAEIERLRAAEDHDLRSKKSLRAEIERLNGERVGDQHRMFHYEGEIERLQTLLNASESLKSGYLAEIERLRACRTELDYVFEYYTHGLRPLDLRDWYNRACTALKDTKP